MEFPAYADILVDVKDYVMTISINRPHRKNAMRPETISEMIHAFDLAKESDEVRAIVLTGSGGVFSTGADLKAMRGGTDDKESPVSADPGGFPKLNLLLEELGKPTIAKVEGMAVAGGMGLMMACNVSISSDDAFFSTPEIKRGLWPMMIMRHIFRSMPYKKAVELIMTGRKVDAKEAEAIGVITKAVAKEKLDSEVNEMAELLVSNSPAIMRLGLNAMYKQFTMDSKEAFPYLSEQLQECMKTEDFFEGIQAFAQKRKPVWKGK